MCAAAQDGHEHRQTIGQAAGCLQGDGLNVYDNIYNKSYNISYDILYTMYHIYDIWYMMIYKIYNVSYNISYNISYTMYHIYDMFIYDDIQNVWYVIYDTLLLLYLTYYHI